MTIIVHYHEIALKGKNRGDFEDALIRRMREVLGSGWVIKRIQGAILLDGKGDDVVEKLQRVFGIAHFVIAEELPVKLIDGIDAVISAIESQLAHILPTSYKLQATSSFAIAVKRSDKRFPLTSAELEIKLGQWVRDTFGWEVDLDHPDLTIALELISDHIYLSFDFSTSYKLQATNSRHPGPGGLPTGTAGRVLTLISGGLDSPVAAWQLMKRGAISDFVHFHSYPQTDRRSIEKVKRVVDVLTRWQGSAQLFLVPFFPIQQEIVKVCDRRYTILLYRRIMLKIAETLARKYGLQALVTGDSLGQVASQTLENIAAVNVVATWPVFRPLIGTDKEEIIQRARSIGTYDISIEPHEDCCTLFVPRNPVTHARISDLEREERKLNITTLIEQAVASVEDVRVDIKSQRL